LAVATSVAVAAVVTEADSTKTAATKVIAEAETDLPPTSTDVAGDDDEGSETTTESVSYVHNNLFFEYFPNQGN
jgi:hypothetical protein